MSLCSVSIQTLLWVPWQWGQLEPVPCICETPRGSSVLKCSVPALVLKALRCGAEASGVQCNIGLWWSWEPVLGSTTKSDWVQTRRFRTVFKLTRFPAEFNPLFVSFRSWRAPQTKQRDASDECSASELNTFTGFRSTPKTRWPVYNTCYQKSYYLFVLPYRKFVVKGLFSLPIMTGLQLPALYSLDIERNETTFTLHVLS